MKNTPRIPRRTVLKGLGTAIALPCLEIMEPDVRGAENASSKETIPNRMAFYYVPNGVNMEDWTPARPGTLGTLPPLMEPLAPFKQNLLVLTGLMQDKARANGDGAGDHARAMAAFLTGRQPRKTSGADIRAGISVDQVAAQRLGKFTRFGSLELGVEQGAQAGSCDSGYSCAYSSNLSWRGESTPNAKEVNPRLVFDRLFGNGDPKATAESLSKRERYRKSILDFALADAKQLRGKLGGADVRKLDEYLSSIRELEQQFAQVEVLDKPEFRPDYTRPAGVPKDYGQHLRMMADMMVLAFQADLTRVATFAFANEGSNRSYSFMGVPEGHHDLSHHEHKPEKREKIAKINRFHMDQFAYLLGKLRSIKEGSGTLLDHCMLLYGSGIADGNAHAHHDLPILMAGRGCGTLKTGRHIVYKRETPLNNLFLAMLERMGVPVPTLGDSTGKLGQLF